MSESAAERSASPLRPNTPAAAARPVAGGGAAATDLHQADPAVRRNTLIALPLAAALLLLVGWLFRSHLDHLGMNTSDQMVDSSERVQESLVRVLLAGAALLALLAGFWTRLARRIYAAGRYPFAQARLFHDMKILRGDALAAYVRRTRRSAGVALTLCYGLLLAALLLPSYFAWLHPVLAQGHIVFHFVVKGAAAAAAKP